MEEKPGKRNGYGLGCKGVLGRNQRMNANGCIIDFEICFNRIQTFLSTFELNSKEIKIKLSFWIISKIECWNLVQKFKI
jgi:hypothetical protein